MFNGALKAIADGKHAKKRRHIGDEVSEPDELEISDSEHQFPIFRFFSPLLPLATMIACSQAIVSLDLTSAHALLHTHRVRFRDAMPLMAVLPSHPRGLSQGSKQRASRVPFIPHKCSLSAWYFWRLYAGGAVRDMAVSAYPSPPCCHL
jgi:hypothetical protein